MKNLLVVFAFAIMSSLSLVSCGGAESCDEECKKECEGKSKGECKKPCATDSAMAPCHSTRTDAGVDAPVMEVEKGTGEAEEKGAAHEAHDDHDHTEHEHTDGD